MKKSSAGAESQQRSFVIFTGQVSPKALFALEKHSEITILYKKICRECGIAGGPAKAEATRRLWEAEDAEEWEAKAIDLASDVQGLVNSAPLYILPH